MDSMTNTYASMPTWKDTLRSTDSTNMQTVYVFIAGLVSSQAALILHTNQGNTLVCYAARSFLTGPINLNQFAALPIELAAPCRSAWEKVSVVDRMFIVAFCRSLSGLIDSHVLFLFQSLKIFSGF